MKPETSQELRGLVREVLKEAMANRAAPKQGAETIRIGSDAELQAFVARLSSPGVIESVRAGKLRFTLGHTAPAPTGSGDILEGVISRTENFRPGGKRHPHSGSHRRAHAAGARQGPQTWSEN